jgi:hypothetical protein
MSSLGRRVLLLMIPLNLVLLAWVWFGRIFFGAGGWFLLILLYVLPFVFAGLILTTILGFTRPGRPRALTSAQAKAQLLVWCGMLGFGFFLVDFGDMDDSDLSAFTQVVGRNDVTLSISWTLTAVSTLVTAVAWIALLVLLIAQRRAALSAGTPALDPVPGSPGAR